jgi:hypothetical protein
MAAEEPGGIFSYKEAYEIAKKILSEKPKEKQAIVSDPSKYWLP